MKASRRFPAFGRPVWLAGFLMLSLVGCGPDESAGNDPVARDQTQAQAKEAMRKESHKESKGVSQKQSTTNAMQAGARQQQAGKR